jgi:DNA-directed RNA polymerase subunit alpha
MKYAYLSETVGIKKISETKTEGVFEIDGLYAGYGITIGNSLRRVLFSSLPGSVITQIKIKGVSHEFSTLPGVMEDIVELSLNLKKIRFLTHSDEPQVITLKAKGEKVVTAADIKVNAQVEVINLDSYIATLSSKNAELDMELTVEKGLGFMSAEARQKEKLPIGVIILDAAFSPVIKANFGVENMRIEDRTDFNRLKVEITTDGSIAPSVALRKACNILQDHFAKISEIAVEGDEEEKKVAKKTTKKEEKEEDK